VCTGRLTDTLHSGRNDLVLWLVESYISERGVPVYPTDVSPVNICRTWTPVLGSGKHFTNGSENGMVIIAFCGPINVSIMILHRMVEWLTSDVGGRCKICPCPCREVLLYILESNPHPNLIRTSFCRFLKRKKKLVRGSNPHLSFNRPLPTRQPDSVMSDDGESDE